MIFAQLFYVMIFLLSTFFFLGFSLCWCIFWFLSSVRDVIFFCNILIFFSFLLYFFNDKFHFMTVYNLLRGWSPHQSEKGNSLFFMQIHSVPQRPCPFLDRHIVTIFFLKSVYKKSRKHICYLGRDQVHFCTRNSWIFEYSRS